MRQPTGPRRARSVNAYLRQTRIMAILALAALVSGIVSDSMNGEFWTHHPLLAGLVASAIVVMLSLAVVNEVIERRRRQRWSILAQYVMFELVRNARMIWLGILEVTDQLSEIKDGEDIESAAQLVRDSTRLSSALQTSIDNEDGRLRLHSEIAFLAEHSDEIHSRWAAIMLNAEAYAEILDRHVELAGDIAWIASLLDASNPPDDPRRQKRARSSPASQIQSTLSAGSLVDRLVVITQLAETLDSGTLELALRIVPIEWWKARLGA